MNKGIMPSGSMNTSNMEASIRLPQHPVWHKSWRRTVRVCERELHPQGMLRYGSREQIQSGVHFLKKNHAPLGFSMFKKIEYMKTSNPIFRWVYQLLFAITQYLTETREGRFIWIHCFYQSQWGGLQQSGFFQGGGSMWCRRFSL